MIAWLTTAAAVTVTRKATTFAQADDEAIDQKWQRVVVEGDTNSDRGDLDPEMHAIEDGCATIVGTTNFLVSRR